MKREYNLTPPPGTLDPAAHIPGSSAPGYSESATEKQVNYVRALAREREISEEHRSQILARCDAWEVDHDDLSKVRASDWIGRLLEKPHRLRAAGQLTARDIVGEHHDYKPPTPEQVRAGHYALKQESSGELRFYHVWRGDRNPNYVRLYVEHGPDDGQIRFASFEFKAILAKIAEDPATAARTYGRHIKSCSECGRRLTNRISRLLDIGPICGGHFYDEEIWNRMRQEARSALLAAGLDPDADVEDTDDLDRIREQATCSPTHLRPERRARAHA